MKIIPIPDTLTDASGALRSLWLALMLRADENGHLSVSVKTLETELEYSRQRIRTLLGKLTSNQLINQRATNKATNITICGYDDLMRSAKTKKTTTNQRSNQRATNEITTEAKRFKPPTKEEVQAYIDTMGFHWGNADTFIDFYTSKGWKVGDQPMKDWKAAMRTWENKWKEKYGGIENRHSPRRGAGIVAQSEDDYKGSF